MLGNTKVSCLLGLNGNPPTTNGYAISKQGDLNGVKKFISLASPLSNGIDHKSLASADGHTSVGKSAIFNCIHLWNQVIM